MDLICILIFTGLVLLHFWVWSLTTTMSMMMMILPYRPLPSPNAPLQVYRRISILNLKKKISKILVSAFETNIMISQNCTFLDFRVMQHFVIRSPKGQFWGREFWSNLKEAGGFGWSPSMKITVIFWQKIIFRSLIQKTCQNVNLE